MPEYSKEGRINLELLSKNDNFSRWMFEEIKPFLKGSILEIGSGRGTYSELVIENFPNNKIILSDIDTGYVDELKRKYQQHKSSIPIYKIDLGNKLDFRAINKVDSVFALNVLEHIKDDIHALKNVYELLAPGGRFIILVPAYPFLFNCIDKSVGHYRRYTKRTMFNKISQTKFKVKSLFYFNFLSIFGWYWQGNILKKEILNEAALSFLNKLVPLIRIFERYILRKRFGLSLIIVLEK